MYKWVRLLYILTLGAARDFPAEEGVSRPSGCHYWEARLCPESGDHRAQNLGAFCRKLPVIIELGKGWCAS